MADFHYISREQLDLYKIQDILQKDIKLKLSEESIEKIVQCRIYLDAKLKESDDPIYGINTGFGSLYNVKINRDQLQKLQENLVMSHACGTGEEVPPEIVKLMLLFKIQSLSYGFSGVQLKTVDRLLDFFNYNVYPVVYTQGSLGASGDLAPLAHLSLPLIGQGEVYYEGEKRKAKDILDLFGWEPIALSSKEGLALLNGTQFMSAYGIYLLLKAFKLSYLADLIGSLSLEAFNGNLSSFESMIHLIRPHRGQLKTAERIRGFLKGSELMEQSKKHVQDPYSFRCIPQVHGAVKDALRYVEKTMLVEINAVTDNPNIFVDQDRIISGGNFHGQPLAFALDFLGMTFAEIGSISERRIFQLISGARELPPFLVDNPGLNSGFMIPQYTAASIISQNKQYATPASTDSIVSSNGQEDHVSMGANAATKAKRIVDNVQTILAIELMNASQALYFRRPLKTSSFLEIFLEAYRAEVPFIANDKVLHDDMMKSDQFIESIMIDNEDMFG
ncbi:MAG: histidine ammonia-lyase [Lutimonas sp.]